MDFELAKDTSAVFQFRFSEENDRVIAVTCTAHLEDMLHAVLVKGLPAADASLRKRLFSPNENGALSTFGNRAHLARAMGILDEMHYDDLQIIGAVRNEFAHKMRVDSFDHTKVSGKLSSLKIPKWRSDLGDDTPKTAKSAFITSALQIAQRLHIVLDFAVFYGFALSGGDEQGGVNLKRNTADQ